MIVNVDGYISELPQGAEWLEFRSGEDGTAGTLTVRGQDGVMLETKSIAAEFNLPQRPWWERLEDVQNPDLDPRDRDEVYHGLGDFDGGEDTHA